MIVVNSQFVNGGIITVNSSTLANTILQAAGGSTDGSLTATHTSGATIQILLLGFTILDSLSASGSCGITAAVNSIPINFSFTGGATLTLVNDTNALAYTPSNPVNLSPVPTTVQDALDQLAIP